jgi:hypothetical protein
MRLRIKPIRRADGIEAARKVLVQQTAKKI